MCLRLHDGGGALLLDGLDGGEGSGGLDLQTLGLHDWSGTFLLLHRQGGLLWWRGILCRCSLLADSRSGLRWLVRLRNNSARSLVLFDDRLRRHGLLIGSDRAWRRKHRRTGNLRLCGVHGD